jgi:hypothetical protein
VLEQHLACSALEYPVHVEHDDEYFGSGLQTAVKELIKQGRLGRRPSNVPEAQSWNYIGQEVRHLKFDGVRVTFFLMITSNIASLMITLFLSKDLKYVLTSAGQPSLSSPSLQFLFPPRIRHLLHILYVLSTLVILAIPLDIPN